MPMTTESMPPGIDPELVVDEIARSLETLASLDEQPLREKTAAARAERRPRRGRDRIATATIGYDPGRGFWAPGGRVITVSGNRLEPFHFSLDAYACAG
jgi:hypothetical protein